MAWLTRCLAWLKRLYQRMPPWLEDHTPYAGIAEGALRRHERAQPPAASEEGTQQGDDVLLQLIAYGNQHALRTLYDRYSRHVFSLALHITGERRQAEGPGQNYLIQHSAGSGKSNTIAWLAHRLASLHDAHDHKIFNSVIVVTDRTVLDAQLQDTIYQFEHKQGVVVRITDEGAKSAQVASALVGNAPIIIVTLQAFSFVLPELRKHTSLGQRSFAVIADEAHSSQTGTAASALSRVLAAEQIAEGAEWGAEDLLLADMEQRAEHRNISYFAFTATPKAKTLMRFGRYPFPDQPPSEINTPQAFHTYTMQQAIEEGCMSFSHRGSQARLILLANLSSADEERSKV